MKRVLTFIIVAIVFLLPVYSLAATINVPGDQPNIQAGIDAANDGDTVLIADGTYTGTGNYNINFNGKAITVSSANGPENCIIDCQHLGRGFLFYSGETEVSVLEGLTIRNGSAESANSTNGYGGGVYANGSSPSIVNCVFENNSAFIYGGAVYYYDTPRSSLFNNRYYDTSLSSPSSLNNCTFTNNSASTGGAVYCGSASVFTSAFKFTNCIFTGNNAVNKECGISLAGSGGAVSSFNGVSSSFTNCIFTGMKWTPSQGQFFLKLRCIPFCF